MGRNKIPYICIGNEEIEARRAVTKPVYAGDEIACSLCNRSHLLEAGKDKDGNDDYLLLFYTCGTASYLYAISNVPLEFRL